MYCAALCPYTLHMMSCRVTRTEGRRYIDRQAEREALREEVFKHLADRGIDIEPIIKEQDHKGR